MPNYKRVLIPMNLALGSGLLTPAVRRLIGIQDTEITLLHVVESQPWLGRDGQTTRLMSELEVFAHRQLRGARISRRIEWGRVADCILHTAESTRADVLLISAGRPGERAHSAIAAEVLAEVACPVLIEWMVSAPVNRARTQPVCCALELGGSELEVLGEAVWAASRMEAPLKVISALTPEGSHSALLWDPDERTRATAERLARVSEVCSRWAPEAEVQVGVGAPAYVVSRALRLHGAGLLVTGGEPDAPLAAESECPVLYVGGARARRAGHPGAGRQASMEQRRTA